MNNYLVRVPGSINSKTGTQVKIVQRWDGKRPKIQYVFGDFLAYLTDREEILQKRPESNSSYKYQKWLEYCEGGL